MMVFNHDGSSSSIPQDGITILADRTSYGSHMKQQGVMSGKFNQVPVKDAVEPIIDGLENEKRKYDTTMESGYAGSYMEDSRGRLKSCD